MQQYKARVEKCADALRQRIQHTPKVGIVLGTGLGGLVSEIDDREEIPYADLPGFPVSTAPGHSGALHLGRIGDVPVMAFQGRFHVYEGYDALDITMPIRVMARLGVDQLIITNACGGMNKNLQKGELLVIDDHVNLLGINPLTGTNLDEWGPRFPDMSRPYDPELVQRLLDIAADESIPASKGVYVAVPGPNLETRAEYRWLSTFADVVGMSTVPEVIVAVHEGLRTAGISIVTDLCDPDHLEPVNVEEILQVAAEAEPRLTKMVRRLIEG